MLAALAGEDVADGGRLDDLLIDGDLQLGRRNKDDMLVCAARSH
jgi:hypothetical protein